MTSRRNRPVHLVAAVAMAMVATLPSLVDFHVLARKHAEVESFSDAAASGQPLQVAAGCSHGAARHVEATRLVLLQRCAACVPSQARLLPELPLLGHQLLSFGPPEPMAETAASLLFATPPSSRGPPRA